MEGFTHSYIHSAHSDSAAIHVIKSLEELVQGAHSYVCSAVIPVLIEKALVQGVYFLVIVEKELVQGVYYDV